MWASVARVDAAATASRVAAEAVLLGAGVARLLAVVFTLARAGEAGAPQRGTVIVAITVSSVAGLLGG